MNGYFGHNTSKTNMANVLSSTSKGVTFLQKIPHFSTPTFSIFPPRLLLYVSSLAIMIPNAKIVGQSIDPQFRLQLESTYEAFESGK